MSKFALILILCSMNTNVCLPPYEVPKQYPDIYECFIDGYNYSLDKMRRLGKGEVNKHKLYIRFICKEETVI